MGDSQEHHSPTAWGGGVCSIKDQRVPWVGYPHACLHILTWVLMYEHTRVRAQIEFLILSCIHFV